MKNVVSINQSHLQDRPVAVISAIAQTTNEAERTVYLAVTGKVGDAVALAACLHDRLHQEYSAIRS